MSAAYDLTELLRTAYWPFAYCVRPKLPLNTAYQKGGGVSPSVLAINSAFAALLTVLRDTGEIISSGADFIGVKHSYLVRFIYGSFVTYAKLLSFCNTEPWFAIVLHIYGHITQRMPLNDLKVFVRALAILARNTEYKLKHLI